MATLPEKLLEHGIRSRHYHDGDQKLICPRCSAQRRNRTDPCLSLTIDANGALWKCHHCEWAGSIKTEERPLPRARRAAPLRPQRAPDPLTPSALSWLMARGISEPQRPTGGIAQMIAFVLRHAAWLTDWEIKFAESIRRQRSPLSPKQRAVLRRLVEKAQCAARAT